MSLTLDLQVFKKEDYPEYYRWFQDADLNSQLGPMKEKGEEWLTHVLAERAGLTKQAGCTYSLFSQTEMVAVVGILYPGEENRVYCITSIAVKPLLRGNGIGKKALKELMERHPHKEGQHWIAYVDMGNPKAKLFFERNGWKSTSELPDNSDMFLMEFR